MKFVILKIGKILKNEIDFSLLHIPLLINRLGQEEKAHRSELTHTKMRYDNKIALLQEETQNAQMQLEKARRERDTLRYY